MNTNISPPFGAYHQPGHDNPASVRASASPTPSALAHSWSTLGAISLRHRAFLPLLFVFGTMLWGTFARGAFYQSDLFIFAALSIVTVLIAVLGSPSLRLARWWLLTAIPVVIAVVTSVAVHGDYPDAVYAIAPVVVAVSLGITGSVVAGQGLSFVLIRVVVDVACLQAVLAWTGVALHLEQFAQQLNQGWRAVGTFGYANVTGLFLVVGFLAACCLAATWGHTGDQVRSWLLMLGVLTTQSRGAVLALAVCAIVLYFSSRRMAAVLGRSAAVALVAFLGLLPSVRSDSQGVMLAVVSAALAVTLLIWLHRGTMSVVVRRSCLFGLSVGAGGLICLVLQSRVLDTGSSGGRVELWLGAFADPHIGSLFGQGPRQLAELSRGQLVTLLLHNDLLQYATYYGLLGVLALGFVCYRLVAALSWIRSSRCMEQWAMAASVLVAVTLVALMDFPLQVPLVPGVVALVVGAGIGSEIYHRRDVRCRLARLLHPLRKVNRSPERQEQL